MWLMTAPWLHGADVEARALIIAAWARLVLTVCALTIFEVAGEIAGVSADDGSTTGVAVGET